MKPFLLSRRSKGTLAGVLAAVAAAALLSACSSNPSSTAAPTTSTTKPATVGEVAYGSGVVGQPVPSTSVPTERGTRKINCANDAGQEVIIAQGGYLCPQWLDAEVELPITWTNLSGAPQEIVFDDAPIHTDPIPPGGTFTWHSPPYAVGIQYHTAAGGQGHEGHLQLQNANDDN